MQASFLNLPAPKNDDYRLQVPGLPAPPVNEHLSPEPLLVAASLRGGAREATMSRR